MSERPEWANGPEWDGWKWIPQTACMGRRSNEPNFITIERCGLSFRVRGIYLKTAKAALRIANVIAEDCGGWT